MFNEDLRVPAPKGKIRMARKSKEDVYVFLLGPKTKTVAGMIVPVKTLVGKVALDAKGAPMKDAEGAILMHPNENYFRVMGIPRPGDEGSN